MYNTTLPFAAFASLGTLPYRKTAGNNAGPMQDTGHKIQSDPDKGQLEKTVLSAKKMEQQEH